MTKEEKKAKRKIADKKYYDSEKGRAGCTARNHRAVSMLTNACVAACYFKVPIKDLTPLEIETRRNNILLFREIKTARKQQSN